MCVGYKNRDVRTWEVVARIGFGSMLIVQRIPAGVAYAYDPDLGFGDLRSYT